ncbi:hypothetical protein H6P81_016165 [Aristolochia fimbriata]|uniref:GAG-pre-integrase domain-containing protein n=1 Tax=Aristolochia fimbriata TaxID=158543 RepID=A0AAV7E7G7_ARIFI|nr:hypothetical protein H6P81_016165 [Aristolochia fimbriata]
MTAYIKSIDEDVWLTVLEGWSRPTVVLEGKTLDKPQKNWTDEEKKSNNLNSKAFKYIFCGVSLEEFSRMSAIASTKEAWESLKIHYEGTASVRIAKLQQLITKFELIKMKEDETILEKFSKHGNPSKYGEKKPDKFTAEQIRVQCHGCDGYGHIQTKCPTVQKKKKAHNVTWSDSDSNSSDSDENYTVFFTGVLDDVPPLEIPKDNITLLKGVKDKLNNLSNINRELIVKLNESEASQKFLQIDVMKREESLKLQEKQIEELQKELFSTQQILKKLEKGKGKLDEILSSEKTSNDKSGLGYTGSTSKRQTIFVKEGYQKKRPHKKFKRNGCYYFQDLRHLQSQCYKLFRDLKYSNRGIQRNHLNHKFVWVQMKVSCNHALKAATNSVWYFDSGCSRHMTGKSDLLSNISYTESGQVTFGDGAKDSADIWHQKLGHVHFRHIQKLIKHAAVKELPETKDIRDKHCGDCQRGKQHKIQHKSITQINQQDNGIFLSQEKYAKEMV